MYVAALNALDFHPPRHLRPTMPEPISSHRNRPLTCSTTKLSAKAKHGVASPYLSLPASKRGEWLEQTLEPFRAELMQNMQAGNGCSLTLWEIWMFFVVRTIRDRLSD